MERDFYYVLHTTLLALSPKDTGNMVSHITLEDFGSYWKITISGPRISASGFYDYARDVNERQGIVKTGPNKGANNYKWIERAIRQVSESVGGSVSYELS